MPLLHIDGTGIITYRFAGAGIAGEAAVTMGIQTVANDAAQVAEKANARFLTGMMFNVCHLVNYIGCKVSLRLDGETEIGESFTGTPHAGEASGGMLPANTAVLIQKRTAFAGRKNRGRFYMPGVGTGHVASTSDPNTLSSDTLISWQAKSDEFFAGLNDNVDTDPLHPVILHPSPSTTVTAITAFSVQARLATQRGRLRD